MANHGPCSFAAVTLPPMWFSQPVAQFSVLNTNAPNQVALRE